MVRSLGSSVTPRQVSFLGAAAVRGVKLAESPVLTFFKAPFTHDIFL
jgi:hypothetical protein